jgi:hypothetical protein
LAAARAVAPRTAVARLPAADHGVQFVAERREAMHLLTLFLPHQARAVEGGRRILIQILVYNLDIS